MSGYIDVPDYVASQPATDPLTLLQESRIRVRYLKQLLAERDAEVERLEGEVNYAYRQLAGLE